MHTIRGETHPRNRGLQLAATGELKQSEDMKILFLIIPGNGSATLGHVNLTIITPKKITLTQKKKIIIKIIKKIMENTRIS